MRWSAIPAYTAVSTEHVLPETFSAAQSRGRRRRRPRPRRSPGWPADRGLYCGNRYLVSYSAVPLSVPACCCPVPVSVAGPAGGRSQELRTCLEVEELFNNIFHTQAPNRTYFR